MFFIVVSYLLILRNICPQSLHILSCLHSLLRCLFEYLLSLYLLVYQVDLLLYWSTLLSDQVPTYLNVSVGSLLQMVDVSNYMSMVEVDLGIGLD